MLLLPTNSAVLRETNVAFCHGEEMPRKIETCERPGIRLNVPRLLYSFSKDDKLLLLLCHNESRDLGAGQLVAY